MRMDEEERALMRRIWSLPMTPFGGDRTTIGKYLRNMLATLWHKPNEFEGKRPFGYSGWKADIEIALIKAGLVEGVIDDDGFLQEITKAEEARAYAMIEDLIWSLRPPREKKTREPNIAPI